MAYDQHGPWEKAPGPIGAEAWVRSGLRALLASVPPAQVDLGVAGYGYAWEPGRRRQLSDAAARALVARPVGPDLLSRVTAVRFRARRDPTAGRPPRPIA